jgi:hypothetical protein
MKIIRKGKDKILWIFSESLHSWVRPDQIEMDENLDLGNVLTELIKEKMEEKKDLSYGMAFSEVQKENLELARRYADQLRAKR